MSHKSAPSLTPDQERFEAWWKVRLAAHAATCGFGRDEHGNYFAVFARDAWSAWQAAQAGRNE